MSGYEWILLRCEVNINIILTYPSSTAITTNTNTSMNDTAFDFSAIGFLVLDTLCRQCDEMPPTGGATFVEQIRMTPSGAAVWCRL